MNQMSVAEARTLLNLDCDADPVAVKAAYVEATSQLEPARLRHLPDAVHVTASQTCSGFAKRTKS